VGPCLHRIADPGATQVSRVVVAIEPLDRSLSRRFVYFLPNQALQSFLHIPQQIKPLLARAPSVFLAKNLLQTRSCTI